MGKIFALDIAVVFNEKTYALMPQAYKDAHPYDALKGTFPLLTIKYLKYDEEEEVELTCYANGKKLLLGGRANEFGSVEGFILRTKESFVALSLVNDLGIVLNPMTEISSLGAKVQVLTSGGWFSFLQKSVQVTPAMLNAYFEETWPVDAAQELKDLESTAGGGEVERASVADVDSILNWERSPANPKAFIDETVLQEVCKRFSETIVKKGAVLTSDLKVSNPMGKYNMGDVIPKKTPLEDIFKGILSKTYYPTLTPPRVSIASLYPDIAEVGKVLEVPSVRVLFNRGSISPQYSAESPYRAGEATKYKLAIHGDDDFYYDSEDGVFYPWSLTKMAPGAARVLGTVEYAEGVQPKDSDGNNYDSPLAAGSISATKTIEFILPFYYGASDSPDISDFTGLNKDLTKKGNKAYTFTTDNQRMVVAYDASYGNLKSIIDPNGFEAISGWNPSEVEVNGQTYKVYVAEYATTSTNSEFTFKF